MSTLAAPALEQARSAGRLPPVHDDRWAQARNLHGEQDGTRATIDTTCRLLRLPSVRNEFNEIADRAVKDRITGGKLRPEPNGEIAESVWTPISDVVGLRRSSLVDIGLALAQTLPATGHVAPAPVIGLIQH